MKNELKISTLSIVCVLCATAFSSAYGASTVRTLGGTGTYNSASAASASGTSTGVARAGVARVTPAAGRVTSTSTTSGTTSSAATTASRVSTAPRLSLGKYLGGTTTVNRPSGGNNPGLSGDEDYSQDMEKLRQQLQQQIDAANKKLEDAVDAVAGLQETVDSIAQSSVQGVVDGGYISVDKDGMAYLNVEELGKDSKATVSDDGKKLTIRIGADGTPFSVDLPDLLSSADINAKLEEKLTEYVTQKDFDEWKTTVQGLSTTGEELKTALSGKADVADLDAKADKLTAGNYTVGNIATVGAYGQYVDGGVSADDFAKDSDLKKLATDIGAVNESGQVINRFETLQQEINENMTQMLETNFTEVVDGKLVIKENSITSTELAPNSVTSVELANGAVEEENLAEAITKQLIGDGYEDAAKEYPGGVAIMLVDEFGNKIWTPLEFADAESDTGGNN